eukprot:138316-Rhodomonas_salina.1
MPPSLEAALALALALRPRLPTAGTRRQIKNYPIQALGMAASCAEELGGRRGSRGRGQRSGWRWARAAAAAAAARRRWRKGSMSAGSKSSARGGAMPADASADCSIRISG